MSQFLSLLPQLQPASSVLKLTQPTIQYYFVENLFSLAIIQKQTKTQIIMDLLYTHLNTEELPTLIECLEKNLPSVLSAICYNDQGLPFHEEVRNTEIGHLFEHILLEYLCQHKLAKGARRATFAGRTKWNWTRDPLGRFHIHLSCGRKDADILPPALEKTVNLMKIILGYNQMILIADTNTPQSDLKNVKNGESSI